MTKKRSQNDYTVLSQQAHILKRPDMFVGSTHCRIGDDNADRWCYYENGQPIQKDVIPAMWKLFDELAQNVIDVYEKNRINEFEKPVKNVWITLEESTITVKNDGSGVPIEKHVEGSKRLKRDVLCPELVWFHFATGDNFENDRTVGGKNGYGAKLAGVFSTHYQLKTQDEKGNKFKMVAQNNMQKLGKAKVTQSKSEKESKPFTEVKFTVDLEQFYVKNAMNRKVRINKIPEDTVFAIRKRVEDMANFMPDVCVKFNGKRIKAKTFVQQAKGVLGDKNILFSHVEENKMVAVGVRSSDVGTGFCSYTNGIFNRLGGRHVKNLFTSFHHGLQLFSDYKKSGISRNMLQRRLLCLVVHKNVVNPDFDGQCKDELKSADTGCNTAVDYKNENHKKYFMSIRKSLKDYIKMKSDAREKSDAKKSDGQNNRYVNVDDLSDARFAGTKRSSECALFITEGKSAARLVANMCDKSTYGVIPIRGKFVNAGKKSISEFNKTKEVISLKKALGLKQNSKDIKSLRYGKVILFTDQDSDGYHIRMLLITMFGVYWPELFKQGFVYVFETPIVKAKDWLGHTLEFFDQEKFERHQKEYTGWKYTYYKGLGSSTDAEAKEYFKRRRQLMKKVVGDVNEIISVMGKGDVAKNYRKVLSSGEKECNVTNRGDVRFIIKRQFANYAYMSSLRKIPNMYDGLVPAMRKVLFHAMKSLKGNDNQVDRFANRAADVTHYHHGSTNLIGVIVNMASDYVGGINVPYFFKGGQFGSRHNDEHAAGRYIKTGLLPHVNILYPPIDTQFYKTNLDDGEEIEPQYMVPIIPMLLVNGLKGGLGCGWLSEIPPRSIKGVIDMVRQKINNVEVTVPPVFYKNFHGLVNHEDSYTAGVYDFNEADKTFMVTELPIGLKTEKFVKDIKKVTNKVEVMDNHGQGDIIQLKITDYPRELMDKHMRKGIKQSWVAFNEKSQIEEFKSDPCMHILNRFMKERTSIYESRRQKLASSKFLEYADVEVKRRVVDTFLKKEWKPSDVADDEGVKSVLQKLQSGFDYVITEKDLDVSIRKLNEKHKMALTSKSKKLFAEHHAIKNKPIHETWLEELDMLEEALSGSDKNKRKM